jgi:hypothetical protein
MVNCLPLEVGRPAELPWSPDQGGHDPLRFGDSRKREIVQSSTPH